MKPSSPERLFDLAGKLALVSGASSMGLGRHFARRLAQAGAEVIVTARSSDKLKALVVEIAAAGGRIHPHYGVFAPIRHEYVDLVASAPLGRLRQPVVPPRLHAGAEPG